MSQDQLKLDSIRRWWSTVEPGEALIKGEINDVRWALALLTKEREAKQQILEKVKLLHENIGNWKMDDARLWTVYTDICSIMNSMNEPIPEKGYGPIVLHQNEDGSVQLRDSLSRMWCACGQPAVHYFNAELPQYQFKCIKCALEGNEPNEGNAT